jgi:uncharacterized protein YbjT (DUF2867 family)
MNLVIGATGQLGTAVVRKLVAKGQSVRALVRESSDYQRLQAEGVEIAFGDLRDPATIQAAVNGAQVVLSTATAVAPREKGDTIEAVDVKGHRDLIDICKQEGIEQFIYISAVSRNTWVPIGRAKHIIEQHLQNSGLNYTIFRSTAFMDIYLAFMGSDIPIRGTEAASVLRPYKFAQGFFNSVKDNIEQKGQAGILGTGSTRHSFICVNDAAEFMVNAIGHPEAANAIFDIGGPEALTYLDAKAIYEKVLGKSLTAKHTPALIFKLGSTLLRPFAPTEANIMALNYVSATEEGVVDATYAARIFGVQLTSAEEFLQERAAKPA